MATMTSQFERTVLLSTQETLFWQIYLLTGFEDNLPATATAAAATVTATAAASAGLEHCPYYFELAIRDDNLAADGFVQVEIIRDAAGAGGGATVLWQQHFKWDISEDPIVFSLEFLLPALIQSGTNGETLDITVTTGVAADEITANIWYIDKAN